MTREEAIDMCMEVRDYLTSGNPMWDKDKVGDALDMAIEALEVEPRPIDPTVEVDLASGVVPKGALNRVTNPPKVTIHMNRPKGRWIGIVKLEDRPSYKWYWCSECEMLVESKVNFCPNCGADMRQNLFGKHADVTIIDEACMKGADDE